MKTPKSFFRAKDVQVQTVYVPVSGGDTIETYVVTPDDLTGKAPCLLYIHGGGFVLEAAGYHYKNALRYARESGCIVVFPKYRLAPQYPFPTFLEDCYAALEYLAEKADEFGIDERRIGVGGDSAGASISAGLCMMARDRKASIQPCLQLLIYPFLDGRNTSESCRKYTDTPMWNSSLSSTITPMVKADPEHSMYRYYSVAEAEDLRDLPPAYIETAEFDCLHDDGILYARLLEDQGTDVELFETKGTMHGFDIMASAPISKDAVEHRIRFLKRCWTKK